MKGKMVENSGIIHAKIQAMHVMVHQLETTKNGAWLDSHLVELLSKEIAKYNGKKPFKPQYDETRSPTGSGGVFNSGRR